MPVVRVLQYLIATVAIAATSTAHAGNDDFGMPGIPSIEAVSSRPLSGGPTAYGAGVAMSIVPTKIPMYLSFSGGFTATPRSHPVLIDTFHFATDFGIKPESRKGQLLIPFAGVSLRVLSVSRFAPDARDRYTTVAAGASGGVMGDLPFGSRLFYRAVVTVLASRAPDGVPGTSVEGRLGVGTRFGF